MSDLLSKKEIQNLLDGNPNYGIIVEGCGDTHVSVHATKNGFKTSKIFEVDHETLLLIKEEIDYFLENSNHIRIAEVKSKIHMLGFELAELEDELEHLTKHN